MPGLQLLNWSQHNEMAITGGLLCPLRSPESKLGSLFCFENQFKQRDQPRSFGLDLTRKPNWVHG